MTRRLTRPLAILSGSLLLAAALAACGSSSDGSTTDAAGSAAASSSTTSASKPTGGARVGLSDAAGIGEILVDADGRTLYLFEADTGSTSTCSGACAQAWPPFLSKGQPAGSGGVDDSLLGTTKRDDGSVQVTYAGHPLYYYAGDSGPGEANGNGNEGFGAEWYALTASGDPAEEGSSGSGDGSGAGDEGSTSSDSGSGY